MKSAIKTASKEAKMNTKGKKKKNILYRKLMDEGYENISDFMSRSGIPMVGETVRRAIYEDIPVSSYSLATIMIYLNFEPMEIKKALEETGEKIISSLISDQKIQLTIWEKELTIILPIRYYLIISYR